MIGDVPAPVALFSISTITHTITITMIGDITIATAITITVIGDITITATIIIIIMLRDQR